MSTCVKKAAAFERWERAINAAREMYIKQQTLDLMYECISEDYDSGLLSMDELAYLQDSLVELVGV